MQLLKFSGLHVLAIFFVILSPSSIFAIDTCGMGVADPPFLSYAVKPNLLMIIDNSASMFDQAYVNTEKSGYCYVADTSYPEDLDGDGVLDAGEDIDGDFILTPQYNYDSNVPYAGYFDAAILSWYKYDSGTDQFVPVTSTDASTFCTGATGTKYKSSEMCLTIDETTNEDVNDNGVLDAGEDIDGDGVLDLSTVNAFAARGRLLNWLSASKFDIEKEILTGGKYDSVHQQLIMESRGCMDKPYIKEVTLDGDVFATFGIRPPDDDEKTTDLAHNGAISNTRIEIYKVSADGFIFEACQDAIDAFGAENPSLGDIKTATKACMEATGSTLSASHTAANHIIQECWYYNDKGYFQPGAGTLTSMKSDCAKVYNATNVTLDPAASKEPPDPAYANPDSLSPTDICFGQYQNVVADRYGYVGQCWEPWYSGVMTCTDRPCDPATETTFTTPDIQCDTTPCCYDNGDGTGVSKFCAGNFNKGKCIGSPGSWLTEQDCTGGGGGPPDFVGWTDDDAGDPDADSCVQAALESYCLNMDEVTTLDPSDSLDSSGSAWGIPSVLIDSAIGAQLGGPLTTLIGRVQVLAPPTGLLQEQAESLRIGAMVFNEGTVSECESIESPPGSGRYIANLFDCLVDKGLYINAASIPDTTKQDGGKIVTYIGPPVNADQATIDAHNADLVNGVNDIQALTWTPLAESLYNAIGYYSQNAGMRLNATDFNLPSDPIEQWCQSNNVLIITEGSSTTDLHSSINTLFTTKTPDTDGADTEVTGDETSFKCGALSGSTYLDDLAFYAQTELFGDQNTSLDPQNKRNIKTYAVVSGVLRNTGTDECSPDVLLQNTTNNGGTTLYTAEHPDQLTTYLRKIFSEIRSGASSGSAASVISSSRSGEGAIYQAIFWPEVDTPAGDTVSWLGEVHSMMIDSLGQMYEDTNGDRILGSGDSRIIVYFDVIEGKSMACYDIVVNGACPAGMKKDIADVRYLWSAGSWLANIEPLNNNLATLTPAVQSDIYENRTDYYNLNNKYISADKKRFIFTWNDLDNDGIVDDATEILDFADRSPGDSTPLANNWSGLVIPAGANRGSVINDFNAADNDEVNQIVRWLRGADLTGQRNRTVQVDLDYDPATGDIDGNDNVTWRLGDVIHSTPTAVTSPAEGYHLIYRDSSFAEFYNQYQDRRHMVYFGANDGMMHGVNGGFYNEHLNKFCLTEDCTDPPSAPELGAELWAYAPYNLLPHLKCLTNPNYQHKYYVDQRPRIFDVRIFADDADHPNGWGTILVGAMRFGGAKVNAADLNGDATDLREFTSAYFIMDITNPEKPPKLLAELTRTTTQTIVVGVDDEVDLGYTTPIPTMVIMKDSFDLTNPATADYSWYLVFGNGPRSLATPDDALLGESDQDARISILPLDWLVDTADAPGRKSFRIPVASPIAGNDEGGTFVLTASPQGFVSDLITVDYDLDENYRADAVYFGTVEGAAPNWTGKMYRLVTYSEDAGGDQEDTLPSQWSSLLASSFLDNPNILLDTQQPIVAAASVGKDTDDNYWVYFGTGRFYSAADKTNTDQQTYYGIKEPMDCAGTIGSTDRRNFTWATVGKAGAWDSIPGAQGLLQVDQIWVTEAASPAEAALSCLDGTPDCLTAAPDLPADPNLDDLIEVIVGTGCREDIQDADGAGSDTGYDGWYKNFLDPRERNLGQATLLGGLLTFTTYQPYDNVCQSEGEGFLYGTYYQTGTPWFESVFGDEGRDNGYVLDKISLGRGLTESPNIHTGKSEDDDGGIKVFLQTSTGEIKELPQTKLPYKNYKTGRQSWREIQSNSSCP